MLGSRIEISKVLPTGQIQPATCLCTASRLRMFFYIFKWLEKIKRIIHDP